jgi:hypothetical protein
MVIRLRGWICGDRQIRAMAAEAIAISQNLRITDKKLLL